MEINNISFCAKLVRQEKKSGKYAAKKDIIKSYDKQIELIQEQKKRALELDDFMHSKKITKLIEELPKDDVVRVANKFCFKVTPDNNLKRYDHLVGFFHKEDADNFERSSLSDTFISVQKKDGSIDKDKIERYLQEMVKIFN